MYQQTAVVRAYRRIRRTNSRHSCANRRPRSRYVVEAKNRRWNITERRGGEGSERYVPRGTSLQEIGLWQAAARNTVSVYSADPPARQPPRTARIPSSARHAVTLTATAPEGWRYRTVAAVRSLAVSPEFRYSCKPGRCNCRSVIRSVPFSSLTDVDRPTPPNADLDRPRQRLFIAMTSSRKQPASKKRWWPPR